MSGPFSRKPPDDDAPRWRELESPGEGGGAGDPAPPASDEAPSATEPPPPAPPSWVDQPPPGTLLDDRPRPPRIGEDDGVPRIRLTRWNPYKKLTPENRRFVKELLRFPQVTAGIIGLLAVVYLWMIAAGWEFTWILPSRWGYPLAVAFGALEPERVRAGEWWRLFTAALLHGSLFHMAINGFMLYQLGRLAENIFGRVGLVVLFVGSALCGTAASAFIGGHMSVGASGAVMGLVGACIAFGLRHRRAIPEFLRGLFGPTLYVYVALILAIGLVPGIDGWGHFGGAVGGALLGLLLPSPILREGRRQPPWIYLPFAASVAFAGASVAMVVPHVLAFDGQVASEAMETFEEAVREGRWEQAAAALDEAAEVEPDSPILVALRQQLALLAMTEERWALACEQLAVVEATDPEAMRDDPAWFNDYAWALFMAFPADSERLAYGVELSRASLKEEPDHPVFLNTLAWGLFLAGDFHGALGTIEEAMSANNGKGLADDIYIYVASLYAVGRRDEAVDTYREAVAQHPDGVLRDEVQGMINRWEDAGGFDPALVRPPAASAPPSADPPAAAPASPTGDPAATPPLVGDDDSAEWEAPAATWI
jgi:membrane associated rhomboid family serine protease